MRSPVKKKKWQGSLSCLPNATWLFKFQSYWSYDMASDGVEMTSVFPKSHHLGLYDFYKKLENH